MNPPQITAALLYQLSFYSPVPPETSKLLIPQPTSEETLFLCTMITRTLKVGHLPLYFGLMQTDTKPVCS